jgi:hypothetical protein
MAKKKKFYKKAKPKEEKKKLPINSRIITEKIKSDHFIFLLGISCVLAAILVVSIDLYRNYKLQRGLTNEKIKVLNELVYWQNEIKAKTDYRDGYFKLAILNYQLKDYGKAQEYLSKTMSLDPNFEKGKELEQLLSGH